MPCEREAPNRPEARKPALERPALWLKMLAGTGLAYLAVLQFHAYFSHFVDDEYLHMLVMRDNGVFGFVRHFYMQWDGRFFSFFQMYWLHKINGALPLTRFMAATHGALIAGALFALQRRFLDSGGIRGNTGALWGLCVVETAMVFMVIPNKAEVIVWLPGAPVYLVPFYFLILALAAGDRLGTAHGRSANLFLAGFFSFLAGGCSEIYGAMALGLGFAFLCVKVLRDRGIPQSLRVGEALRAVDHVYKNIVALPYSFYFAFLFCHLAGFLLIALSPGHARRKALAHVSDLPLWQDVQRVLMNTLAEAAKPKLYMIPVLAFLAAWLIVGFSNQKESAARGKAPGNGLILGLVLFMNASLLLAMNSISQFSAGQPLTLRAYTPPFLFLFLLTVPALATVVRNGGGLFSWRGKAYFVVKEAAAICLTLFFGFHLAHGIFQYDLIPETLRRHRAMESLEALLTSPPGGDGPVVAEPIPQATMHRHKPLSENPQWPLNRRLAEVYGLDRPLAASREEVKKEETMMELVIRAIKNRLFL